MREEKFLDEDKKTCRRLTIIDSNERHGYYQEQDDQEQTRALQVRDSHKDTVAQAQNESIIGGIITLLMPVPITDPFRAQYLNDLDQ